MKPMIFFDVDGTLMDNQHHQVSPSTIKALKQLKEKGYKIGIATGRAVKSLERTGVKDVIAWDGFVCNNGQTVLDNNYEIIKEYIIDPSIVHKCIKIAKENNIPLVVKMENRIITQAPNEYVHIARKFFNSVIPPIGTYNNEKAEAMIAYGPLGYDYKIFKNIEGIKVLPGVSTYCDITHANTSKAIGIKNLLDIYNCKEYICFGDSLNDIEMFESASTSVCMGQGDEHAKDKANYVTNSIYDDGIYNACKKLKLI